MSLNSSFPFFCLFLTRDNNLERDSSPEQGPCRNCWPDVCPGGEGESEEEEEDESVTELKKPNSDEVKGLREEGRASEGTALSPQLIGVLCVLRERPAARSTPPRRCPLLSTTSSPSSSRVSRWRTVSVASGSEQPSGWLTRSERIFFSHLSPLREEEVLRDVVFRGNQRDGQPQGFAHWVCGVSSKAFTWYLAGVGDDSPWRATCGFRSRWTGRPGGSGN